jgi:hypothetical protein
LTINAEQREKTIDKKTGREKWVWRKIGNRPDHLRDCELEILAMADMRGLLEGYTAPVTPQDSQPDTQETDESRPPATL